MEPTPSLIAASCTGKAVFANRSLALVGISKRNRGLVQPYHCKVCHQWHVGSNTHNRGRQLQRKKTIQKREKS